MSWYDRASRDDLPVSIVGGSPMRSFRCPDCRRTWSDPEVAFEHVMAGCVPASTGAGVEAPSPVPADSGATGRDRHPGVGTPVPRVRQASGSRSWNEWDE